MSKLAVNFRGERVALDDSLLLGQGGEARVFRHPDVNLGLALKIFHDVDVTDPLALKLAKLRKAKLDAFAKLSATSPLPSSVIAPVDVITTKAGDVVGYAMPLVSNASDIAVLAKLSSKKGAGAATFDNASVLAIFAKLVAVLDEVHSRDVVVGDMNDGNIVLSNGEPCFIDADSMQLSSTLPCPVAHERFLDPRLYRRSLVDVACFDPESDHYALRVLLFQSLLCIHPYGGVHATFPTLLRRAEASHSILRGDVQLPRNCVHFDTLGDDMLDDFTRAFDKRERAPLPTALLTSTKFTRCGCGVEHARLTCPACKTVVQAPAIRTSGGCVEETILKTRGIVLQVRSLSGQLAFLVDEDGRVRREDHSTVLVGQRAHTTRLEIAGSATWVGDGAQLVKVDGERVVDRALTAERNGAPVFAAGRDGLFVVEGDTLVHHETRARVGRVFEGQTALWSSDVGGVGAYWAGRKLMMLAFTRAGVVDIELAHVQPRGKLVDVNVTFDEDGSALIGFACDDAGQRMHTLAYVDARGRLIASATGTPESARILQSISGKLLARGKALSTSSDGILAIHVDKGALRDGTQFTDTRDFVDASVEIHPATGGALYVATSRAITLLRLSGRRT